MCPQNALTVFAPAKVNLYLKIIGKRPDGFHELSTVFHRISLGDRLTLTKKCSSGFHLTTNHPQLQNQKQNLIYRAYQLLDRLNVWRGGVSVRLEKNIPIAAGLGGGSSDAAAFLLGVNQLFGLHLPLKTLLRIGNQLGSDVPFFIHNINQAVGRGRGERLTPLLFKGKIWFVLVSPSFGLETAGVYREYSSRFKVKRLSRAWLTRISHVVTITSVFFQKFERGPVSRLKLENDLFRAGILLRPELAELDGFLEQLGARKRLLSGSGPTFFSVHNTAAGAGQMARRIEKCKLRLRVFICHTY